MVPIGFALLVSIFVVVDEYAYINNDIYCEMVVGSLSARHNPSVIRNKLIRKCELNWEKCYGVGR